MEERMIINEMLQDEDIKKFINEEKITNQQFETYLSFFLNYYFNIKKCRACSGKCSQNREFMMPKLIKDGNYIDLDYVPCKFKSNDYLNNITFLSTSFDNSGEIKVDKERVEVLNFIKQYLNNLGTDQIGLYLYGKYGTGKSYLMQYIAYEVAKRGYKVVFAYYPDFSRRIMSYMNDGGFEDIIDDLKSVDYLFLDDLGGDYNSPFLRDNILLPILQYRMTNHKPLFITSNLSLDELKDHLAKTSKDIDEMKASRVCERIRTLCKAIELKGKNYR